MQKRVDTKSINKNTDKTNDAQLDSHGKPQSNNSSTQAHTQNQDMKHEEDYVDGAHDAQGEDIRRSREKAEDFQNQL
jgi:hypothetical protein